jgi:YidC/Oxa1 family membrane protein insertase
MNLDFLYIAVSWVLLRWHSLFTAMGLDPKGGLNWSLSIVFLVITARLLLFRFFVKQVHYQRRMQEMQPKIKKLQEKHKGDKAALQREMMALQQAEGFNPITGCLPMFLQIPVFISLFHVLKHLANATNPGYPESKLTLYTFTSEQTLNGAHAKLFGAPLAASLHDSPAKIIALGGDVTATRVVTIILVVVSALATFITQRAVIANQTTPAEGQAAMIQKLMLVGIPISVVFSGFIFPLGVLLYWFTSNVWTMFQQFYIHRFHPHVPEAAAAKAAPTGELGRSLAPPPGAKPQYKGNRGAASSAAGKSTDSSGATDNSGDSATGSTTRPVNRSQQRPGGGRPANKRPTQSKKRR